MLYIDDLPNDVFYEICKYLRLKDWCLLYSANRSLRTKMATLQDSLLTYEILRFRNIHSLRKDSNINLYINYNHDTLISHSVTQTGTYRPHYLKQIFYDFIKFHINEQVKRFDEYRTSDFLWNPKYIKRSSLQRYILDFPYLHYIPVHVEYLTASTTINNIFNRVLTFYAQNNFNHLTSYSNKYELFVLYILLHVDLYQYTQNVCYTLDFLRDLATWNVAENTSNVAENTGTYDPFYEIKIVYYRYILHGLHYNCINQTVDVDNVVYICKYITNLSILSRTFRHRVLDLTKTEFDIGCEQCNIVDLFDICFIKMTNQEDPIVCANYKRIKEFLKRTNQFYYNMINTRELYLVNSFIYITNPKTNRRIAINGGTYKRMIRTMYRAAFLKRDMNMYKHYDDITTYISRKQHYLRKRIFS